MFSLHTSKALTINKTVAVSDVRISLKQDYKANLLFFNDRVRLDPDVFGSGTSELKIQAVKTATWTN